MAAILAGLVTDSSFEAVSAVLLVLPVALFSHWLTCYLGNRWPMGAFVGMSFGAIARATVMIAGGLILQTQTDWFETRGVALWVWMIGVYLSTLACELALWLVPAPESQRGSDHVGTR